MAGTSEHAILDLGEDDFISTDYKNQAPGDMSQFPPPDTPGSFKDTERLVDEEAGSSGIFNSSFWTLGFYQQFFDVETATVKNRLLYSMVPVPGKSFLEHHIRPKPDLYGPFWICVTLVFSIAISGNIADFLSTSAPEGHSTWHYDFHKVSLAATAVFSYAGLVPSILYTVLWYCGSCSLTFLELLCLYGYSLSIYIPVSVLWLIPSTAWQWLCVLLGAGLSGAVLAIPLYPAVRNNAVRGATLLMVVILGLHLLLACGFMLYFFHLPPAPLTPDTGKNSTDNSEKPNGIVEAPKVNETLSLSKQDSAVNASAAKIVDPGLVKSANLTAGEKSSEETANEKRSSGGGDSVINSKETESIKKEDDDKLNIQEVVNEADESDKVVKGKLAEDQPSANQTIQR